MKLTDVLANKLKENHVGHVFGLQGGAVVHIFDSLERHNINVTYTLHEQAAALAAAAYSKVSSKLGCCVVTTGPGGTNSLTGLLGAWNDSTPTIFISGQVRSEHMSYGKNVRQVGTQECPIAEVVKPLVKAKRVLQKSEDLPEIIDELIDIATCRRPGPIWLDIPSEYQWVDIEFRKKKKKINRIKHLIDFQNYDLLIKRAKKPVLVIGNGIHLSRTEKKCIDYIRKTEIPFVTTWTAQDLLPTQHKLNGGVIGMSGQKGANKIMFNADLIICLGTHLSIPHTTTLIDDYGKQAKKISINIDYEQIKNYSNINFDLFVHCDLKDFFEQVSYEKKEDLWDITKYKEKNWYDPDDKKKINSNIWNKLLTSNAPAKSCFIIDGGGTALYTGFQSTIINGNKQRIICSSGMSSMGTGLAETVGVFTAKQFEKYFCIIGDCSFFMNIQDLQTIKQLSIPVIISVINNNGQLAIRNTQKTFQNSRYYGTHPQWGLSLPTIENVTKAFEVQYFRLTENRDMNGLMDIVKKLRTPAVVEVMTSEDQEVLFSQKFTKLDENKFVPHDLSDMYP